MLKRVILSVLIGMLGLLIVTSETNAEIVPVALSQFSDTNASGYLLGDPVPYGFTNNTDDSGWIWSDSDYFTVNFGTPKAINKFRVWSVYTVSTRGAKWEILYSDDGVTFTHEAYFDYVTTNGVGVNDNGTIRSDFAGWYKIDFNTGKTPHQYWKIMDIQTLVGHSPRSAQIEFYSEGIPQEDTNSESFSASIGRMISQKGTITCSNLTTGNAKTLKVVKGVTEWDCEKAGVVVNKGDKIQIKTTVNGIAK